MAEALTVMAVATFIKDAMEVWDKIENSFSRVSQNRRGAQRLVREIRNDLILLKELYEDHHATLDESPRTKTAIRSLIDNMGQALGTCTQLLPPTSEKQFEKYTLKFYAWKNGSKIEEELLDLKSHVSDCRQRFQTLAIARLEIQGIEHHRVHISRTDNMQNMLSGLAVSADRLRAFNPDHSGISPCIVIDIPNEHLKIILKPISEYLQLYASSYQYGHLSMCWSITIGSDNDLFPHDRESLHRETVAFALYTQKQIKIKFPWTNAEQSNHIARLTRMARRLGMSQEADSIDWIKLFRWTVIDHFRPRIRRLACVHGTSMVPSSNSEVLRHLDIYDHKVDLFFRFFEHHSDAVDKSQAFWMEIIWASGVIWFFHRYYQQFLPKVEAIQQEIKNLQIYARKIHKLDKSLPLFDM